jgi:hypothetical protein
MERQAHTHCLTLAAPTWPRLWGRDITAALWVRTSLRSCLGHAHCRAFAHASSGCAVGPRIRAFRAAPSRAALHCAALNAHSLCCAICRPRLLGRAPWPRPAGRAVVAAPAPRDCRLTRLGTLWWPAPAALACVHVALGVAGEPLRFRNAFAPVALSSVYGSAPGRLHPSGGAASEHLVRGGCTSSRRCVAWTVSRLCASMVRPRISRRPAPRRLHPSGGAASEPLVRARLRLLEALRRIDGFLRLDTPST